jgi:hypothetical protein
MYLSSLYIVVTSSILIYSNVAGHWYYPWLSPAAMTFIIFQNKIFRRLMIYDLSHCTTKNTYWLTPRSRVLLEKPTGLQLVKKFPSFYGTWRFNTAYTSARPPVPILGQLDPVHTPHSTSWRSFLILSSHLRLGLPSGLFPSGFPINILYTPLLSPTRETWPAHFKYFCNIMVIYRRNAISE